MQSMIDPDTALRLVVEHAAPLPPVTFPTGEASGLVLAQPIVADRDYPPFPRAMMDGYAVQIADAGKTLPVVGEIAAGQVAKEALAPGTTVEIMTGAPCPVGTEAVVQKELVKREGSRVTVPDEVSLGQNITPTGSECVKGREVLAAGDTLTPLGLAAAATFGYTSLHVYPKPSLAIVTTGDELVPVDVEPGPAQIRNSNGLMLAAMAGIVGISDVKPSHAVDTMDALARCLGEARSADVIILTGAVSAGKYDSVPDALTQYGATIVFHKVTQRPGKPILFATRGAQLIFGLPGNPLSCHLGFHRYVATAVKRLMGKDPERDLLHGSLAEPITIKGPRTVFQLARAKRKSGKWRVTPCKGRGSADLYTATRANALIRFEPNVGELNEGADVAFELLDK